MKRTADKSQLVAAWIEKADKDLRLAELAVQNSQEMNDLISFHAQQCTEKYLKSALVFLKVRFPKTHDLSELCRLLESRWDNMPFTAEEVAELTDYAISSRYPDEWEDISFTEAQQAIETAKRIKDAVLSFLKEKGYEE